MPTTFRPYAPNQLHLLPPSPKDWLPEGHLANFISDVVDDLDLKDFYDPYEGDGRRNRPFDPRMMIKRRDENRETEKRAQSADEILSALLERRMIKHRITLRIPTAES